MGKWEMKCSMICCVTEAPILLDYLCVDKCYGPEGQTVGEGGSWASAFTHLNALLGREEGVGPPLLQEGDGPPLTQVQAVLTGGIRAFRH